jgi:hypothetical protein
MGYTYKKIARWRERPARATSSITKNIMVTSETLAIATTMEIYLNFNSQHPNNPQFPSPDRSGNPFIFIAHGLNHGL